MAYDGSVKFDTSIDTNGFKLGMSKIKSLASGMVKTIGAAITAVSGGIIAAGTAAVNVGMDFEAAMSKVSSISGATGEQLQALTDKAKEMGATTKFSATESAEAFQYMAMAGWDTQSMLDGIDGIMNLSAADGLDLATTSDIVTDALTAFGLSAKDSTHFADVLAKTSSSANTNVSMLGESFKYVAPLAGAMKYSVEDVSLALGLMANSSVKGSMAGTSLKTAIANLSKPTKMMKTALRDLGLAAEQTTTSVNQLDVDKAMTKQKKAVQSLNEEQTKYSNAVKKYGKDSTQAKKAALNLESAQQRLTEAEQKLAEAQAGKVEQTGFVVTAMKNADGTTKSLRETLIELRKAFSTLDETQKAEYASTIFGKEAMSGMLAIINASDKDFNTLIENIDSADGSAKKMADTLNDNLKGDITIAKSALEGLGITISETLNDGLREAVQTGTKYIDRLSKAFTDGGLSGAVEEAGKIFGELAGKIAGYAPDMIQAAVTFIKSFAKGIFDNKDKIIEAAKDILNTLKNTLIELLPKSIKTPVADIIGKTENVIGNITTTFRKVFTSKTIENAVKFAVDVIGTLTDVLTDIINAVLPAVEDGFKEIQKALNSTGFKNAVKFVKDAFKNIGKYIENVAKVVIPIFTDAISFVIQNLDGIIPLLTTVAGGFAAFKIVQSVVTWCEGFAGTIKNLVGKLTDFISKLTTTKTATMAADGATKAFNTTLALNPAIMVATVIGTLVSALMVLGTYLATSTGKTKELWDATDRLREQQEKTAESAEKLGEKLGSVGEYAQQFSDDIDNAKSALDGVKDSAITDTKKMSELQTNLEETQQKFNEIAGKYSDSRKQMTEDEIKSLEDLFEKMRELSKKELELTQDYQDAAKTQAETWSSMFVGNADEYAEASKPYIKAAEETRDKVIAAADSQYQAQVLNINKMTGLSEKQRQEKLKQAQKDHDTAVSNAKKECADTLAIFEKDYLDRTNINVGFLDDTTDFYQRYINIMKNHTDNVRAINQSTANDQKQHDIEMTDEVTKWNNAMSDLYDEFNDNFDDTEARYLGTWLEIVKKNVENGKQIGDDTAAMVEFYLIALDRLPPESKEKMQSTIDGLKYVADKLPPQMKTKAEAAANSYAEGVGSTPAYLKCKNNAERLTNAAVEAAENSKAKDRMFKLGQDLVSGFVSGQNSLFDTVIAAAKLMTSSACNTVQETEKSNSPSKVTRKLGNYFSEGYALGIADGEDDVNDTVTALSEKAINGISGKIGDTVISAKMSLGLNDGFANSRLLTRLKTAVMAETSGISSAMVGRNTARYNTFSGNDSGGILKASGNIETHISIDGREFAVATVPYIDEEMAFKS